MARLLLLLVACPSIALGWFLLRNAIGGDHAADWPPRDSGAGVWFVFTLNWSLRLLFAGGGVYLLLVSLFGREASVRKAVRGIRDGL